MYIVGAGMAGCLAGVLNPTARIFEAAPSFRQNHDAVLRFRDDQVSKQVGIPFKKVKVRKGIFVDDKFVEPNIKWANLYSVKVTRGRIMDRSIWNTEASTRYVAPSDFHEMLADMCHNRIEYGCQYDFKSHMQERCISTIPMNRLAEAFDYHMRSDFNYKPIQVDRFKVLCSDVYQTIYYPSHDTNIYRITLTGEDLIVESIQDNYSDDSMVLLYDLVDQSFGIPAYALQSHVKSDQRYGKIEPIDDRERKQFMFEMTRRYNIYSLGRFATWRNILLDDVLSDIFKIREMINISDYDFVKELSNAS